MIMIMSTSVPVKLLCAEAAQETRNHLPRGRRAAHSTDSLWGLPVLNRAIEEAFQKDQGATHLRDVSGFKDNFLSALLEGLHKELSSRYRGSSLFVEGFAQSLAVHLVRTMSMKSPKTTRADYRGLG
jgi:hypothetical protein